MCMWELELGVGAEIVLWRGNAGFVNWEGYSS